MLRWSDRVPDFDVLLCSPKPTPQEVVVLCDRVVISEPSAEVDRLTDIDPFAGDGETPDSLDPTKYVDTGKFGCGL